MAHRAAPRSFGARVYGAVLCAGLLAGGAGDVRSSAQSPAMGLVASRNVNMVSGQELPNGDPYLQRQNEPSVAASTRNPLHLLAGANDYRTVDIPGSFEDGETGDAWLGVFKSFDGGERWRSTLLPGYPQDTTPEGMASPLKAYHAGADPVVRPGTNGLIYYSGLAFNRGEGAPSAIFVSRFVDNNNKENGDPIAYLSTAIVASSTGASFLDKPWMAVDVPRAGARVCRIQNVQASPVVKPPKPRHGHGDDDDDDDRDDRDRGRSNDRKSNDKDDKKGKDKKGGDHPHQSPRTISQQILAGTMYVAYASITTTTNAAGVSDVASKIMLSRSEDCGATWTKPQQISRPEDKVNQGATIAIDPRNGAVHVAWRQFGLSETAPDAMMMTSSQGAGKAFDKPRRAHQFPTGRRADQLLPKLKRSHRMGDVHELVSIKPFDSGTAEDRFRTNAYPTIAIDDESRVYLAWTARGYGAARPDPTAGDARVVLATSKAGGPWTTPRPVDSYAAGTDLPGHQMMPSMTFAGGRLVIAYYDLRQDVSQVFGAFVDENDAVYTSNKRHTIDLRAVQASKGDVPVFGESTMVSQYLMGNLRGQGTSQEKQLQFNAPNLPLFQLGSVPFMGDYIDIAPAPAFVQSASGQWTFNTASTTAPVFHAVWTDNRDVQKPRDGDWKNYTPPGAATCAPGQTGMRNQNVYSARLTMGLLAGSPGNTKPLDPSVPRAFVVFAQNTTYTIKNFRLTIAAQPAGGQASFDQLGLAAGGSLLTSVDVTVAPRSMVTRTVYATSSDPKTQVAVDVAEILAPQAPALISGGLASRVILNPDISNPDISNPDISNPDISNPDISNAEVYNPDISNPDISNPDISNPDISNPDISNPDISNVRVANPDISNPDISNPDISNPDISNPDISNPDISNPDISNGTLTDVTWTVTNTGNTTAAFNVNLFLAQQASAAGGIKTQLVVHKTYTTPVSNGCDLGSQTQTVLVANILNPTFKTPGDSTVFDPANPDISNTTLWLEPGGTGKITLRIVDPDPKDEFEINPVEDLPTPVVQADPINTESLRDPTPEPPATPAPTDPPAPPAPDMVELAYLLPFVPTATLVDQPLAPIVVRAVAGGNPAPGVQVTLAIATNPSGGHLNGVTTVLTDGNGDATFAGLFIERAGVGYRLSASAAAAGAMPIISAPFAIKAIPVVTALWDATVVYDGQPHPATCGMTGLNGAPIPGPVPSYSSVTAPVDAGSHSATCAFAGDALYEPASADATLVITKAATTTTVTCPASVPYTGSPQLVCSAVVTGAGGLNESVAVTYANNTSAGTATATATYAGTVNHNASSNSAPFTILAPILTGEWSGTYSWDCGSGRTGTASISLTINAPNPIGFSPGAVTYLGGTGSASISRYSGAIGNSDPYGNIIRVNAPASTGNHTSNIFDGTLSDPGVLTITGTTLNGDTPVFTSAGCSAPSGPSGTFVITKTPSPFVVTTTADAGAGSLRDVMTLANATPGHDTVRFAILGGGEKVIALTSPLPVVASPMALLGQTQPGYDGRPMVRVDGQGTGGYGFELQHKSKITGLSVTRFTAQPAVIVTGAGGGSIIELSYIGTDRLGAGGLGNNAGVMLSGTSGVRVRNSLLSGNSFSGVIVSGGSANEIRNNHIGTGLDGLGVLPNLDNGITLFGGAGATVIDSNVISGNGLAGGGNGFGIDIQQSGALADVVGTVITNNTIGIDAGGNLIDRGGAHYIDPGPAATDFGPVSRGNAGGGIRIQRGSGTIIGGAGGGNTVSGNTGTGIRIEGSMAVAPVITRNRVGTNPAGTVAIGNAVGIDVFLSSAMIGGPAATDRNIVSGNIRDGIAANGNTTIENNFVGTDVTGTLPMGNSPWNGPDCCHTNIFVNAPNNTVRGNVVAGNNAHLQNPSIRSGGALGAAPNIIEDNTVGTDLTGTLDLGNGVGIGLFGDQSGTIVRRNLIAFNDYFGVWLVEGTQGALIGGAVAADGNVIRDNLSGVVVGYNLTAGDAGNRILSNAMTSHQWRAILLGSNHGPGNDAGDGDTGPNGQQNFPVLSNVSNAGAATTVDYTLDSLEISANHTIQVFASTVCHVEGYGEGGRLVGSFVQQSDGSGDMSVVGAVLDELVPVGQFLTATATDSAGNTSEFSACVTVPAPPPPAFTSWASSGNGVVTTTDNGVADGTPQMTYAHNGNPNFSGAWQMATVAADTRTVNLAWTWNGFHSWFMVTAKLEVFVTRGGSDVSVVTLLNVGPTSCCAGAPSGGFSYGGNTSVAVQAGDTYGFRLYGTHFDGTYVLQGTFDVIVDGTEVPLSAPSPVVDLTQASLPESRAHPFEPRTAWALAPPVARRHVGRGL